MADSRVKDDGQSLVFRNDLPVDELLALERLRVKGMWDRTERQRSEILNLEKAKEALLARISELEAIVRHLQRPVERNVLEERLGAIEKHLRRIGR